MNDFKEPSKGVLGSGEDPRDIKRRPGEPRVEHLPYAASLRGTVAWLGLEASGFRALGV